MVIVTAKYLSAEERDTLQNQTARIIERDGLGRERIMPELRETLKGVERTEGT